MADKKITDLNSLSIAAINDVFAIVDIDANPLLNETKKISLTDLMGSPGSIGHDNPDKGIFTALEISGNEINEFSIDGTLAGDSDTALPTEKAVKTYVDNAIVAGTSGTSGTSGAAGTSGSSGTSGAAGTSGTSGASGTSGTSGSSGTSGVSAIGGSFVHTQTVDATCWTVIHNLGVKYVNVEVIDSTGYAFKGRYNYPIIEFIDTTSLTICFLEEETGWAAVTSGGGTAGSSGTSGVSGTSGSSGSSGTSGSGTSGTSGTGSSLNIRHVSVDSTAIANDILLVDTTTGDVNIELYELPTGKIIIKKITSDINKIIVTGRVGQIDGAATLEIDISYQTFTLLSDGSNFYVI